MAKAEWRTLEELVLKIQKGLAPAAAVEHDKKIIGRITGVERQIDVWVTQNIGQYSMSIAIDCKATKRPTDTKCVEEFHGLVKDVGASKGVLVCPAGFTATAKKTAKHYMIELYRPVDTGDHKWKVRANLPALCDFRGAAISFGIRTSAPMPFAIREHVAYMKVFDKEKSALGTALEVATKRWNSGDYPTAPGVHDDLDIFGDTETYVDNGYGEMAPVRLYVGLEVKQQLYFGNLPIDQISGFLNVQTGSVVTNSFAVGLLTPSAVESTWKRVADVESLPVKPVLRLIGLECWSD
ncbi:MAG TPA: restriction endonuclease [Noviherbaspirillum sp.]|nr:restriction endonuclease [Noviherbaspirillum sp.]